jgi:hypothetical protein
LGPPQAGARPLTSPRPPNQKRSCDAKHGDANLSISCSPVNFPYLLHQGDRIQEGMRCILSGMNNEPVARRFVEMVLKLFVQGSESEENG